MAGLIAGAADIFAEKLAAQQLPAPLTNLSIDDAGLSRSDLAQLFESQATSRRLDLEARRLGGEKRGYYSIGSSGHEGNAAMARALRVSDMAFLHYRSGAFLIERSRQAPGSTPIWDMALSFVASSEDPISGGRHKVLGSKPLFIPPQTSTIASHLPKAVGAAYSVSLARRIGLEDRVLPEDAVIFCNFGDASSNHSTAQGAFNTAAWTAFRNIPLPLVFMCEDNGIGISVPTPEGWVAANYANRPGLVYMACDGRDIASAYLGAQEAARCARLRKKPVFLHMRTVRLMGHAGSDVESAYRSRAEIDTDVDQDPLLHTARRLVQEGGCSLDDVSSIYGRIADQVRGAMENATTRPKLTSAAEVIAPLVPPAKTTPKAPAPADEKDRATAEPQHLSRIISLTLAEEMAAHKEIVVFGEDVGKKGGVYGASVRLQQKFGSGRVFDTLLDEQAILGMAIGLAHNGFLPIPEIQFLAYVHNAEDQIRGEAASLSFFSNGQYTNPMVVRIAGLAYQKGFGGHFHNDNSVSIFRDIPGVIVACPSSAADAARLLHESIRLAREESRVVIFIEPIALYGTKDLHEPGDGLMTAVLDDVKDAAPFGKVALEGNGADLAIVTYGNGAYMSRRCAKNLEQENIRTRIIDLRWLSPLPMEDVLKGVKGAKAVLIVDECRRSGSLSEEIMAKFMEAGLTQPVARLNGEDTFIPLGPAADTVLVSEDGIMDAARALAAANTRTKK